MNRGKNPTGVRAGGYTIVETLIFLATTSAMFVVAMLLVSGQQNKAQFVNVVRDFESKLTDIANDVSTGYYQNNADFRCEVNGSGPNPVFDGNSNKQGANEKCIFVGTVVKFGQGNDREKFTQFAMAGLRTSGGVNVTSVAAANPKVIGDVTHTGSIITSSVGYGATIQCLGGGNGCAPSDTTRAAVGFFTKFVGTSLGGGNGIQTDLFPYPAAVLLNDPVSDAIFKINSTSDYVTGLNPAGGITICLKSGGTSQYALVHIGGGGNNLTISSEIKGYTGDTPSCD